MYEKNDVLAQVLKRAKEDLGENTKGLPDKPPERGSLDICVYRQSLSVHGSFACHAY